MGNRKIVNGIAMLACLTTGFIGVHEPDYQADRQNSTNAQEIDRRSFSLGAIAAFSEMVDLGIKKLGFSTTFKPGEADALLEEAERLAARYSVKLYRENDLIVTDLFSADIAKDLEVLIIYSGDDINDYLALKEKKKKYKEEGKYNKAARREIAFELGRLLSYPDKEIEKTAFRGQTKRTLKQPFYQRFHKGSSRLCLDFAMVSN